MSPETQVRSNTLDPVAIQSRPSRSRLPWALKFLLVYLAGVTIVGKGPTYIGAYPIYWGEVVLLFSGFWAMARWHRVIHRTAQAQLLTNLVICFIGLGAIETAYDIPVWGLDAMRDSAVWYYALFYFVGMVIASGKELGPFASRWKWFWLFAVPWGLADFLSSRRLGAASPVILSNHGTPVLSNTGSELAQSIGLGCLLLLLEPRRTRRWLGSGPRLILVFFSLLYLAASYGRGSRLAILTAIAVLVAINLPSKSGGHPIRRRVGVFVILAVGGLAGALIAGVDVLGTFQLDRFEEVSAGSTEGTAKWRADWWVGVYDAVMEKNPLFGLGFGDPLAEYNPYVVEVESSSARAPHNYNVTVFARMGIVGSVIWAGILLLGLLIPLWRAIRPRGARDRADAGLRAFWIAAIFAIWVNSSFGVLMEGPVDGIPFWLILGMLSMRATSVSPQAPAAVRRYYYPVGLTPVPIPAVAPAVATGTHEGLLSHD